MKMETTDSMLAENIFRLRKERGYKIETLSELSGISKSSLRNYEKVRTSPNTMQLRLLAQALDVDFNELLGGYPNNREIHKTISEIITKLKQLQDEQDGAE